MRYESARSKAVAVARMYYLGNQVVQPLGPGSKEKKSAFVALGQHVGLDLSDVPRKHECGRLIAHKVGVEWDSACTSAGDTVTLTGLNRLVDGVVERTLATGNGSCLAIVRDLATLNPAPRWDDYAEDNEVSNDLSELQESISDAIRTLASPGPVPAGVSLSTSPEMQSTDVRLDDGTWRTPLAAVQGWLNLDEPIDDSSADQFERSLAKLLGLDDATSSSSTEFFERLESRLERAQSFRDAFLDDLENAAEGSETLETATAKWDESWAGVAEAEESETGGPIRAEAKTWPILQFRQYAHDRELDLAPPYQRADVWPTADAQLLIESVLRGIPLPSVILLQHNTDSGDRYEIVDGKQRLTSILRFTASHPKALDTVYQRAEAWGEDGDAMVDLFQKNYPDFKKKWRKHESAALTAKLEKDLYFPFPLRSNAAAALSGDLEQVRGRYYSDIRNIVIQVGSSKRKISSLFETHSDYTIPVIVYQEATSQQIHEVFSLYNKQGKHLNAEEIRNAAFHRLALMRALLVTSGDSDDLGRVAPFLAEEWEILQQAGQALSEPTGPYALPAAGYKRSKALSWVAAALLLESGPPTRSTSSHINALLERVRDDVKDPLRDERRVTRAMLLLAQAVRAHSGASPDTWAPTFPSRSSGRWQELQLVASLVGLAAGYAVLGDELEDVLEEQAQAFYEASSEWARPPKTQSRDQWEFIRGVVDEILEILGVDPDDADKAIRAEVGSSGLLDLLELPRPPWWLPR